MPEEKLNLKVVFTDVDTITNGSDPLDLSPFEQFGRVVMLNLFEDEKRKEEIKDADALFINKVRINKDFLGENPHVKFIGILGTGFDNVDLDYCTEKGITVCNVPSYSQSAVAQQTFAFIIEHFTNTSKFDKLIKDGGWFKNAEIPFAFPMSEIGSKTIGLIGYGKIGHQVAKIARAFGMDVLVYTRSYAKAKADGSQTALEGFLDRADKDVTFTSLENLLRHSDIVSIHCPLNDDSRGLINAETIGMMRKGAFFVNTSRGAIVNEKDLSDALNSGKLSGAGLDVLCNEPMAKDCPLLTAKNCMITPHVGWCPIETRTRLVGEEIKNYKAFLAGNPINALNKR